MDSDVARKFTSPFTPLQLSATVASELQTLAHMLATRNIAAYEQFLLEERGRVDETRWKLLFEKDHVRSYAERASSADESHAEFQADTPSTRLPVVLVTGTIQGDLEDTMLGVVSPTVELMRVKTAYVQDNVVRGSVLASLVSPSAEDPFRSVSVKWLEKGEPLHLRAVMRNRDLVYVEATGIRFLRNGERVGFHMAHSVEFPETPARDVASRGNMSVCAVYRQRDQNTTDVFLKGFLNPGGVLVRSILTRSACRNFLAIANNVRCGRKKKLMWALRQRYGPAAASPTCSSASSSSSSDVDAHPATVQHSVESCAGCGKAVPPLLAAAARMSHGGAKTLRRRRRCSLCDCYLCPDCRISHQLSFLLADGRLEQRLTMVCTDCEHQALAVDAADIAWKEAHESTLAPACSVDDDDVASWS